MNSYKGRHRSKAPALLYLYMAILLSVLVLFYCLGFVFGRARAVDDQELPAPVVETVVELRSAAQPVSEPAPLEPVVCAVQPVPEPEPEPVIAEPLYTDSELETLALIIYQEAGGDACSDETRQMVGEVFLNRVADDRFPDTFQEVATQEQQYGRLHWTGLVWPERADHPGEAHAVERAYAQAEALLAGTVERLLPEDVIFQAEFTQGAEVLAAQDGFYFCR